MSTGSSGQPQAHWSQKAMANDNETLVWSDVGPSPVGRPISRRNGRPGTAGSPVPFRNRACCSEKPGNETKPWTGRLAMVCLVVVELPAITRVSSIR